MRILLNCAINRAFVQQCINIPFAYDICHLTALGADEWFISNNLADITWLLHAYHYCLIAKSMRRNDWLISIILGEKGTKEQMGGRGIGQMCRILSSRGSMPSFGLDEVVCRSTIRSEFGSRWVVSAIPVTRSMQSSIPRCVADPYPPRQH